MAPLSAGLSETRWPVPSLGDGVCVWREGGWEGMSVRQPVDQGVGEGGSRWVERVGAPGSKGGARSTAGSPPWPHHGPGTAADVAAAGPSARSSAGIAHIDKASLRCGHACVSPDGNAG